MKPFLPVAASISNPRVLLTCEHASSDLPAAACAPTPRPWADHRSHDLGAAKVARALAGLLGAPALLAGFSRLWIDANRDPADPELIVDAVDGFSLPFNAALDDAERSRRRDEWHRPYHDAIDTEIARHPSLELLVSIHSFTRRVAGGAERPYSFGILHDGCCAGAKDLLLYMNTHLGETRENEPYSGYEGKIYSIARHGQTSGLAYLEIEMRDDLIDEDTPELIARSLRSIL